MHPGQNAVVNAEGDFYYDPNLIAANHQYRQYHETSMPDRQENRPGNYFQPYYGNSNSPNLFEYGRENSRYAANVPNRPPPNQRANSKRTTKRPKKTKKQLAFFVYARQWFQYISCTSSTGDEAVIPSGQSSAPELKRGTSKRVNTTSSNSKNLNRQSSNKGNKNATNKAPTEKKRNHRHKHIPSQQREEYGNINALNNQFELPPDEEPIPTIAAIVPTSTPALSGGENPSFSLSNLFPTVGEERNIDAAPTTNNYAALFAPVHRGNPNTTPPRPAAAAMPTVEIELETELEDTEFTYQHTYPASPEPSYSVAQDENFMSSASPASHNINVSSQTPPLQSSHQRDQDSTYFNNPLRRHPGGLNQGTSRSLSGTSPLERAQSLRSNNNNSANINRTNTNNGSPTNNNSSRGAAATNIDRIPSTMSYQRRIEEQMRQQQANRR